MRDEVLQFVAASLEKGWSGRPGRALDVGSFDVNGTARSEFKKRGWQYTGFDAESGKNVDVVGSVEHLSKAFPGKPFDCVSCFETLEHLKDPTRAVSEMKRVLRPGGMIILSAAGNGFREHRHPIDCWRILPDGMKVLLDGMGDVFVEEFGGPWGKGILGRAIQL